MNLKEKMSLFRRPKKAAVHRRVFSAADDDENTENSENENTSRKNGDDNVKMDMDIRVKTPPPPIISDTRKHEKKSKEDKKSSSKKSSLLSFGDEGMFSIFFFQYNLNSTISSI